MGFDLFNWFWRRDLGEGPRGHAGLGSRKEIAEGKKPAGQANPSPPQSSRSESVTGSVFDLDCRTCVELTMLGYNQQITELHGLLFKFLLYCPIAWIL